MSDCRGLTLLKQEKEEENIALETKEKLLGAEDAPPGLFAFE